MYPNLNEVEFLDYLAAVKGLDATTAKLRIDELLNLVNLTEVRKRPLGGYSGGMKQRVGIAQALLNDPQVLIVDEPTAGLDPEERVRFRNYTSGVSGGGSGILCPAGHVNPSQFHVATYSFHSLEEMGLLTGANSGRRASQVSTSHGSHPT